MMKPQNVPTVPGPASAAPMTAPAPSGAGVTVEVQRVLAEVQAKAILARQFPRDEIRAFERIMVMCKRPTFAAQALYAYPRGGEEVSGPSVRLTEAVCAIWGNMESGWKEVERRKGESTVRCYAWDAETNNGEAREFVVPHERDVGGKTRPVETNRDIYEVIANAAARRKRGCQEAVIPRDLLEEAEAACRATQIGGDRGAPLIDRVRAMVADFSQLGVTADMLEAKVGHSLAAVNDAQLASLRRIFVSVRDGATKRDEWFARGSAAKASAGAAELTAKLMAQAATPAPEAPSGGAVSAPADDDPAEDAPAR